MTNSIYNCNPKLWLNKIQMEQLISELITEINQTYNIFDETLNIIIYKDIYGKIRIKNNKNNIIFNFLDCVVPYSHNNKELQECCICYEKTINMSSCNHYTCIKCRNTLLNIYKKFDCPMCRNKEIFNKGKTFIIPLKVIKVLLI